MAKRKQKPSTPQTSSGSELSQSSVPEASQLSGSEASQPSSQSSVPEASQPSDSQSVHSSSEKSQPNSSSHASSEGGSSTEEEVHTKKKRRIRSKGSNSKKPRLHDSSEESESPSKRRCNGMRVSNEKKPKKVPLRNSFKKWKSFVDDLHESKEGNSARVAAIHSIGFGAFLQFDFHPYRAGWAANVLSMFEPSSSQLVLPNNVRVDVTSEDVHAVYGAPIGGANVVKAKNDKERNELATCLKNLREYWGIKELSPKPSQMISLLLAKPVDEEGYWIRSFVILAINFFMECTKDVKLYFGCLFSFMDPSRIRTIDWCKYVRKSLIRSVTKWNDHGGRFTGPLPFILIFYLDRIRKEQMDSVPRDIPLISIWRSPLINERMVWERAGGVGVGFVLPPIVLSNNRSQNIDKCGNDTGNTAKVIVIHT